MMIPAMMSHATTHDDGGDEGTRTPDLCDANAALFQLSYIPGGMARGHATAAEVYPRA